jgi:hypothetical protein
MAAKAQPVGELIDRLWAIREDMRALDKQKNEFEIAYDALEDKIKHGLDAQKLDKTGLERLHQSSNPVPHRRWDEFIAYCRKTGNFQLLERRVAVKAWREIVEKTKRPPRGTSTFVKRKLNLVTV